jgi:hypothetical protein
VRFQLIDNYRFVEYVLTNYSELHILVNNAAQTVARPPEYYQALYRLEGAPQNETSKKILCILPASKCFFPQFKIYLILSFPPTYFAISIRRGQRGASK